MERAVVGSIDGVPTNLDESVPILISVGSSDVGGPVAPVVCRGSPHAGNLGADSWRVDEETGTVSAGVQQISTE